MSYPERITIIEDDSGDLDFSAPGYGKEYVLAESRPQPVSGVPSVHSLMKAYSDAGLMTEVGGSSFSEFAKVSLALLQQSAVQRESERVAKNVAETEAILKRVLEKNAVQRVSRIAETGLSQASIDAIGKVLSRYKHTDDYHASTATWDLYEAVCLTPPADGGWVAVTEDKRLTLTIPCDNPDCEGGYSRSHQDTMDFARKHSQEELEASKCKTCRGERQVKRRFDFEWDGIGYNLDEPTQIGAFLTRLNGDAAFSVFQDTPGDEPDMGKKPHELIEVGGRYYTAPNEMFSSLLPPPPADKGKGEQS